ncbi:MAG TPA: N-6 DNA methylase, partial [Ktedonobacterales bacterium]|nr:N-6 DNA methylase [Ktedonobacterales bacterium]
MAQTLIPFSDEPISALIMSDGAQATLPLSSSPLLLSAERLRLVARRALKPKMALGQIFTPVAVSHMMASLLENTEGSIHLLDAGAGTGMLFAAAVSALCAQDSKPTAIHITAFEVDREVAAYARQTLTACEHACHEVGVAFSGEIIEQDFLEAALALSGRDLFSGQAFPSFTHTILNPPYFKISARSRERQLLRLVGIEATNVYTGFLGLAMRLLAPDGQLIAITPRSFCNGAYFTNFRRTLLVNMTKRHIHLFGSRLAIFSDEAKQQETLQETLIFSARRRLAGESLQGNGSVCITTSDGPDDPPLVRDVAYEQVVRPDDPQHFIHISASGTGAQTTRLMSRFACTLGDLGLSVSTGRVVDFRARPFLRADAPSDAVPLIYPTHLLGGSVVWPKSDSKKSNALLVAPATQTLLVPNETYLLVKRFTSKEERRRLVATVYEGKKLPGAWVGFENHLNYFHQHGHGIEIGLARGLGAFLNSTLVDTYFRQFSGHTQVNATDLRSLRYPTREQLIRLGERMGDRCLSQTQLDALVNEELPEMADNTSLDPVAVKQHLDEALAILKELEFPRTQQNERSALTL